MSKDVSTNRDAQAKATEATANAIREAVHALRGLGGYLERIFGTVPEDLIGYFGGDRLKVARAENIVRILQRSKELNDDRGVEPEPISISIALPLLIAASDESRDDLVELWARLLAAAADPKRSRSFRAMFIDIAGKMDPLDAAALKQTHLHRGGLNNISQFGQTITQIQNTLKITADELSVTLGNLVTLGLAAPDVYGQISKVTPLGREFLRAVGEEV